MRTDMEALRELMKGRGIDGAIFCCAELEGNAVELLEKADGILKNNVSLHA